MSRDANQSKKKNRETRVLITGIAGFIGFHLAKKLLSLNYSVIGIDNINHYYDPGLKLDRLRELGYTPTQLEELSGGPIVVEADDRSAIFFKTDLSDRQKMQEIFEAQKPDYVVHLAAQAGVRYSLQNPYTYIQSNIVGFLNLLECCRHNDIKHLVFASSSSVYGSNESMPYSVHHNVDHPISLYAATKKSSELMAHSYAHLYRIPSTGLRFFTVYGPWGRPDMATFIFTKKILENQPIEVFNYGKMRRDFTYIDDIIEGVYRVLFKVPEGNKDWNGLSPDPASSTAPYLLFNIGNHQPVDLIEFISIIEKKLGKKADIKLLPMQKGDVPATYADTDSLYRHAGFRPTTPLDVGLARFIEWYKNYYDSRH